MSPRRRILFPFLGSTLSNATLESALRTARAQGATLVPAYLAMVPNHLSLESALPLRESEAAVPLLELIDQRATSAGVAVDSRIGRGRTPRQALSELMDTERYDTLVVAAQTGESLVDGDPREPGRELRAVGELVEVRVGVDVGLLHHVFRFRVVLHDAAGHAVKPLVVAAHESESDGFSAADVAWLLENASGEVLVLRPGADPESAE